MENTMENTTHDKIEGQMVPRGDIIRAMDDDNLAWLLMDFRIDAIQKKDTGIAYLPDSKAEIAEWLRQLKEKEK